MSPGEAEAINRLEIAERLPSLRRPAPQRTQMPHQLIRSRRQHIRQLVSLKPVPQRLDKQGSRADLNRR
jgi:hypothetical protein